VHLEAFSCVRLRERVSGFEITCSFCGARSCPETTKARVLTLWKEGYVLSPFEQALINRDVAAIEARNSRGEPYSRAALRGRSRHTVLTAEGRAGIHSRIRFCHSAAPLDQGAARMRINRRSLLAGAAASVAVAALPAQASAFRFAVPRRMRCLAYAFADPWRVDFAGGQPYRFIHEASGVEFPPDCVGELDNGLAVYTAIWRDYEPPWPLTASNMEPGEEQPTVYDLPPPALNKAMREGGIDELRELCRAVEFVTLWCRHQAQPTKSDATILLRPLPRIFELRHEEI